MKRVWPAVLALCMALTSCSNAETVQRNDSRYDYLNEVKEFHRKLKQIEAISGFTDEEVAAAGEALIAAEVIGAEEYPEKTWNKAASRAEFIRLIVAATGVALPEEDKTLPGEAWYAPYVRAGYTFDLYPDGGVGLSFLPTDGFFLGDDGYKPMLEPTTREDAQSELNYLFPEEELLPTLQAEDYYGYQEELLSVGAALVCAQRVYERKDERTYTPAEKQIPTPAELIARGSVIHAGGFITSEAGKRISYTNSAEALVNAYRHGCRLIEIDFEQTSDGRLACVHEWVHDWTTERYPEITEKDGMSLEQWMGMKVCNEFSPLCLESLAAFMRQHEDLYIVTDVKSSNIKAAQLIADTCPDLLDRFIIQIYRGNQYDPIKEIGFPNMIFTMYNLQMEKKLDTDYLVSFAADHPLVAYTYENKYLSVEGYTEALLKAGIPLCVHTVNKADGIQRAYDMGITAVYTDNVG